nr:PQQ-dependent sugar dehydrogenase [Microbacterium ulmi]
MTAAALAAALLTAGCSASPPSAPIPPTGSGPASVAPSPTSSAAAVTGWWRPAGAATTLTSGLAAPWSVVPLAGGGALISERGDGTILELRADGSSRVAGTVPGVVSGGEAGLHGLALRSEGDRLWLYAYFGAQDDNRVVRIPLTGEPGSLALGAPEPILTGIHRAGNHNGGRIAFGPDGFLYVATGDAGERDAAQDAASLNGKILRLTPEGDAAPGNPFGTAVWTLGHRNVQGLAWTSDGTMWASEFGQNTWDELNRIEPGTNYGWPLHEGVAGAAGFADPLAVWRPDEASPSGIAAVGDTVFVAGLRGQRLWIVDTDAGARRADPVAALVGEQGRLRDAVAAPDGSLWVLTNNTDGRGSPRPGDDLLLRVPLARG